MTFFNYFNAIQRLFGRYFLSLGLLLFITACATPPKPSQPTVEPPSKVKPEVLAPTTKPESTLDTKILPAKPIKDYLQIGVLLPLSGEHAEKGLQLLEGIEMAAYRFGRDNLTLRIYDTQGRPLMAERAGKQAIVDGADLLFGPLFTHTTLRVTSLARAANIPMISFSNNWEILNEIPRIRDSPVIVFGISPIEELRQLVMLSQSTGIQRLALIAPDDAFGRQIKQQLDRQLKQKSQYLARWAYYDPSKFNYIQPVQQLSDYAERRIAYKAEAQRLSNEGLEENEIKNALNFRETYGPLPFDGLIILAYDDNTLRTLAAQLEYYEVDPKKVRFMGLRQWQNFNGLTDEPSLLSSIFVGLDRLRFNSFAENYTQIHQKQASVLSGLGFDLTSIVAYFDQQQLPTIESLSQQQGFQGSLGYFRIMPNGSVQRQMAIYQIQPEDTALFLSPKVGFDQFD